MSLSLATETRPPDSGKRPGGALDALLNALRLNVGLGRRWSVEQMAEAVGVKTRKLRAIMDGEQLPGFEEGTALACALGAPTLNRVTSAYGFGGSRPVEASGCPFAALAEAGRSAAVLADALQDGRVDHAERPRVLRQLRDMALAAEACAARLEGEAA